MLWAAATEVEGLLHDPDPSVKLRAAHALATIGGIYVKTLEVVDLLPRFEAVEATVQDRRL